MGGIPKFCSTNSNEKMEKRAHMIDWRTEYLCHIVINNVPSSSICLLLLLLSVVMKIKHTKHKRNTTTMLFHTNLKHVHLFLPILLISLSSFANLIHAAACNQQDQNSLLSFYYNISSPSSPLNWSTAVDCCSWEGIACVPVIGSPVFRYPWEVSGEHFRPPSETSPVSLNSISRIIRSQVHSQMGFSHHSIEFRS